MKSYLSGTTLFSTLLVAVAATAEFWNDLLGFRWWFVPLVAAVAAAGNLLLVGRTQSLRYERQAFFLDLTCGRQYEALREFDETVRINIMVTSLLWRRALPRRGLAFFKTYGFENNPPDRRLELLLGQGVAGNAVLKEQWAVGQRNQGRRGTIQFEDASSLSDIDYNMDTGQRRASEDLQLICSYPIRKLVKQGNEVLAAGKIIGVVNIDSQKTAEEWLEAGRLESLTSQVLPDLALAAANILD